MQANLSTDEKIQKTLNGIVDFKPGGTKELEKLLKDAAKEGKQLRVKLGIDPTSTDLHLGHMVCMQKLKQFQELGHQAVLIIGGFTAQVGDPSGRNSARPPLTAEDVAKNAQTYLDQVSKVLDLNKVEIVNNADWFNKFSLNDMLKLAGKVTINQMLAKEAFGKRLDEGNPLFAHEIFYPLLQGFDSVEVKADIELGGTDQTFNLMVGRDLQKAYDQPQQHILTMPLLIGLDGQKKMSKTSLNYIALNDSPEDMFGKTMSISDEMILDYYTLCLSPSAELLKEVADKLSQRETFNPRDIKVELAMRIVETYYSKEEAARAKEHFENLFKKKLVPDDIPECNLSELKDYTLDTGIPLVDLMVLKELAETKAEAKRLIQGGGVKLNGEKVSDVFLKLTVEYMKSINDSTENKDTPVAILQVGKKKFCKLITNATIKV